jgi:predicted MPP superfamily phosphohydrolase
MPLFAVFWLLMNFMAFRMVRHAVGGASSPWFARVFLTVAGLALVPWVALVIMGWPAMDAVPGWAWTISIAWCVSVAVVVCSYPVWRPMLGLLERAARAPGVDPARRDMLKKLGWLVPGGALGFGSTGVAASGSAPFVNHQILHFEDLPEGLDGFKVGHFSDVHVGPFVSPAQVQAGVEALNQAGVDLVVMTGDLLDDVGFMPSLNAVFSRVKARHGIMGILGNHEYYAGLEPYLAHVQNGPMKLLVDESTTLEHNGARLNVSGVDYPFRGMDGQVAAAMGSMRTAQKNAREGDFKLCLAHHPTCWDAAKQFGVHLTLAGHTHGGQVAVGGHSVFASLFRYMLGVYEDGNHKLFVTAGLGHWFPFRIGCPPEVAVIELRRNRSSS